MILQLGDNLFAHALADEELVEEIGKTERVHSRSGRKPEDGAAQYEQALLRKVEVTKIGEKKSKHPKQIEIIKDLLELADRPIIAECHNRSALFRPRQPARCNCGICACFWPARLASVFRRSAAYNSKWRAGDCDTCRT